MPRLVLFDDVGNVRGAAPYVKTYRLKADGEGTVVRSTASTIGAVTDEIREGYRAGGEQVLEALRRFVEAAAG